MIKKSILSISFILHDISKWKLISRFFNFQLFDSFLKLSIDIMLHGFKTKDDKKKYFHYQLFEYRRSLYILLPLHVLKKNITFALFHDLRKVFSKVNSSRNLIFKNVAQITERMDEVRLVDTVCRANNFASLKSSWNNPNSYHMAVLETFPPTQGEINANDAQINFLPPPSRPNFGDGFRQQGIKFAGIRNRRRRIFSREQSRLYVSRIFED